MSPNHASDHPKPPGEEPDAPEPNEGSGGELELQEGASPHPPRARRVGRPRKPDGEAARDIVAIRLAPADLTLLRGLVEHQRQWLEANGLAATVTPADMVRTLIRQAARAYGLTPAATQAPSPTIPVPPREGVSVLPLPAPGRPIASTEPSTSGRRSGAPVDLGEEPSDEQICAALAQLHDQRGVLRRIARASGIALPNLSKIKAGQRAVPKTKRAGLVRAIRAASGQGV